MSWLLAKGYDWAMRGAERKHIAGWRREALAEVSGDVLEIGAGTGANLECYSGQLGRLVMAEPDPHMRKQLAAKASRSPLAVEIADAKAEHLPYDDASFDWVVSTLVLCSVADPAATLREMHRVLRPTGQLAFVEHVLDPEDPRNRRRQRRWQPLWGVIAAHCHVTRDTAATIESCGFLISSMKTGRMRMGPKIVRPMIRGQAARAG